MLCVDSLRVECFCLCLQWLWTAVWHIRQGGADPGFWAGRSCGGNKHRRWWSEVPAGCWQAHRGADRAAWAICHEYPGKPQHDVCQYAVVTKSCDAVLQFQAHSSCCQHCYSCIGTCFWACRRTCTAAHMHVFSAERMLIGWRNSISSPA